MTIEIDDAGTGDIVGDAFIGFLRKETGDIIFRRLPVSLFRDENWDNKKPFIDVVDLVKDGLEALNFNKVSEKVVICRGNFFENVRDYFDEVGIYYEPASIEGKLQDAVESKLIDHLRTLGVRSRNLTKESGAKRFFVLFDWICHDFYNREKFVKNGFKKWKSVWRERAIQKFEKNKQVKINSNNNKNSLL